MRVLVTGASGFLGRALIAALSSSKHKVRASVRRTSAVEFPIDVAIAPLVDLKSTVDWTQSVDQVDTIVHLAGVAHAGPDIPDALYDRVNHCATAELAAAARRAGVKQLVFVSSVRAQSGPIADHVLTEADEPRPTDAYGRSKLAAESAVRDSGVPFTVLRPVLIYGPGVKGNFAALARLACSWLPLPFGLFHNHRSLLSRDNLVTAVQFVLSRTPSGETYLVADAEPVSLADIIASIRRGLGRSPGLFNMPPSLIRTALLIAGRETLWSRLSGDLVVNPNKLIRAGWRPAGNTKATLSGMAAAWREIVQA